MSGDMEYDLVTLGAGSGAPRDFLMFASTQRAGPISADQSSRTRTRGHIVVLSLAELCLLVLQEECGQAASLPQSTVQRLLLSSFLSDSFLLSL